MLRRIFDILSSLKLTIVCLAAALVLVLVGTLAQVSFGIHEVQQRYFQSILVWWPAESHGVQIPVFPGGHLIGAVLLINLIAAHIRRFRWSWSKLGIHLTHAGLIILLVGGLFTDLYSVESFMRLSPGETKNYSEDSLAMELAVIDGSDAQIDQVVAIPESRLKPGRKIQLETLPFRLVVLGFYPNSRIEPLAQAGAGSAPASTQGSGAAAAVKAVARATAQNDRDIESIVVEIIPLPSKENPSPGSLGTWLVSEQLEDLQTFTFGGKPWRLVLRQARHYKSFSLTLKKFSHDRYPGTQIAKNFASSALLEDSERGEKRDVLIYMNHPLRYRGETFFQSGFTQDDSATILQDVSNPSFLAPYIACVVVALGLLIQFLSHFAGFLRRRTTPSR